MFTCFCAVQRSTNVKLPSTNTNLSSRGSARADPRLAARCFPCGPHTFLTSGVSAGFDIRSVSSLEIPSLALHFARLQPLIMSDAAAPAQDPGQEGPNQAQQADRCRHHRPPGVLAVLSIDRPREHHG